MSSCVIEGKRCTACCHAIMVPDGVRKLFLAGKDRPKTVQGGDIGFVRAHWKRMSWRRAKKKNPHLARSGRSEVKMRRNTYFTCKELTPDGCGAYETRPQVCSGYPHYRSNPAGWWNDHIQLYPIPEYHPQCTEWTPIEVKDLGEVTDTQDKATTQQEKADSTQDGGNS